MDGATVCKCIFWNDVKGRMSHCIYCLNTSWKCFFYARFLMAKLFKCMQQSVWYTGVKLVMLLIQICFRHCGIHTQGGLNSKSVSITDCHVPQMIYDAALIFTRIDVFIIILQKGRNSFRRKEIVWTNTLMFWSTSLEIYIYPPQNAFPVWQALYEVMIHENRDQFINT